MQPGTALVRLPCVRPFLTLLTVLALTAVAAPAHAERWSGSDPARDHVVPSSGKDYRGRGDVIRVDVDHAPRRIFVDTVFRTGPYDEMTIFYDTRPGRRGPEFALYKTFYGVTLYPSGPRHGFGDRIRCADLGVDLDHRTWVAHVNRGCLRGPQGRRPAQVRVQVHSADETYYNASDWAPGRHRSSPWLRPN